MIGLLTGVLGFGGLGLRLFLFLGSKIFSGVMTAHRSVTTDGANVWGFLGAAAKPKTAAVSLEMAQRQAMMQGSWFSPIRLFIIIWGITFVWGVYGNWMKVPALKFQIEEMKNDECKDEDERHICQQLNATMVLNGRFQQANKDWADSNDKLKKDYEARLRDLSKTVQAETARAVLANARIKRANDEAAKIVAGADLKPDDYRSFVRDLVRTEAVDSGSGSDRPSGTADNVQPGMLPGAGLVQSPGDQSGTLGSNPQSEAKPDAR